MKFRIGRRCGGRRRRKRKKGGRRERRERRMDGGRRRRERRMGRGQGRGERRGGGERGEGRGRKRRERRGRYIVGDNNSSADRTRHERIGIYGELGWIRTRTPGVSRKHVEVSGAQPASLPHLPVTCNECYLQIMDLESLRVGKGTAFRAIPPQNYPEYHVEWMWKVVGLKFSLPFC